MFRFFSLWLFLFLFLFGLVYLFSWDCEVGYAFHNNLVIVCSTGVIFSLHILSFHHIDYFHSFTFLNTTYSVTISLLCNFFKSRNNCVFVHYPLWIFFASVSILYVEQHFLKLFLLSQVLSESLHIFWVLRAPKQITVSLNFHGIKINHM